MTDLADRLDVLADESNFPADKVTCSYQVLWNAFKRLTAGCPMADKQALFHDTAAAVYSLPGEDLDGADW